jgi:hypothetical protein
LGLNEGILRFGGLFLGAGLPLLLLVFNVVKEAAENGFAADDGSVSGDGRSSRCCTVGELLRDRDCVSAMAVTLVCDEKRVEVRLLVLSSSRHHSASPARLVLDYAKVAR